MTEYETGSCRCGQVTFKVAPPVLWVANCHCTLCQQTNGAAFVTWAAFSNEHYNIDDPHHHFKTYKSNKGERGFCSNCGTPFMFRYVPGGPVENVEWLKEIHFTYANFDPPLKNQPSSNAYYKTHMRWIGDVSQLPES